MTTPLMNQLGIVKRNIERADRAATERLGKLGSATVHEAMGRVGLLKPYMRPIFPDQQVSGTAVSRSCRATSSSRPSRPNARTAISATCLPRASWHAARKRSSSTPACAMCAC